MIPATRSTNKAPAQGPFHICRLRYRACCVLTGWLFCLSLSVQAEALPGAAIATAHPLATEAGHEILAAGGNAFDAAVAISATLAVVEPTGSGLGGGGFWLLHRAEDGFDVMVDGRESAPQAAHRDMYLDDRGDVVPNLSVDGPLAAGIPGTVAALAHISKQYGKLPLARTLQPAIRLARDGFVIDAHYRRLAQFRRDVLRASPAAAAIFLENGDVPAEGFRLHQPDLATTLETVAQQGADGFYQGSIAERLVNGVKAGGGIWTLDDLAAYRVIEREPVHGTYRDLRITSAAPPSSGGIALMTILNILSGYELETLASVQRTHLIIEAMRRAYRDRAEYLGDADFVDVPTARLLSPDYAAGLRAGIHPRRATPSAALPGIKGPNQGNDTTHVSVLDQEGNRVAATLTINYPFGSGFVPPGTGVLLNDEMDDFSIKPGVPNVYGLVGNEANAIAPGKRPLSSMTPTFIDSSRGIAVLGTPGGSRIISMVLLAVLDYANGGDVHSMVTRPRFHHQYLPDVVQYERNALTPEEQQALRNYGHLLEPVDSPYGNLQAVIWERQTKVLQAASDPRVGGSATVR